MSENYCDDLLSVTDQMDLYRNHSTTSHNILKSYPEPWSSAAERVLNLVQNKSQSTHLKIWIECYVTSNHMKRVYFCFQIWSSKNQMSIPSFSGVILGVTKETELRSYFWINMKRYWQMLQQRNKFRNPTYKYYLLWKWRPDGSSHLLLETRVYN